MAVKNCLKCNRRIKIDPPVLKAHGHSFKCPHCKTQQWIIVDWTSKKLSLENPIKSESSGSSEVYGKKMDKKVIQEKSPKEIMVVALTEKGKGTIEQWLNLIDPKNLHKERFLILIIASIDTYTQKAAGPMMLEISERDMFNNIFDSIYPKYGYSKNMALKYLKLILDGELKNPDHKYCDLDYIFKTDFLQYLDGNPAEGLVGARHYYNNGLADGPGITLEDYRKVTKDLAGLSINI